MKEPAKVKSLEKAILLLDLLQREGVPLSLTAIARRMDMAKSTVHTILATLRSHGYVEQSADDGAYRLGSALLQLGNSAAQQWDAVPLARPYLQSIGRKVDQSVHLGKLDHNEVLYLDKWEPPGGVRVVAQIGTRMPLHCSAMGKVLLAYMPEDEAAALLEDQNIAVYTPHTITDKTVLQQQLDEIVRQGYGIENGERIIGMRGVAAPIFDRFGRVEYTIGVTGMFRRISDDGFILATDLCREAARAISLSLGAPKDIL